MDATTCVLKQMERQGVIGHCKRRPDQVGFFSALAHVAPVRTTCTAAVKSFQCIENGENEETALSPESRLEPRKCNHTELAAASRPSRTNPACLPSGCPDSDISFWHKFGIITLPQVYNPMVLNSCISRLPYSGVLLAIKTRP